MKIQVDADACPKAAKEILYKSSQRLKIELVLVANQNMRIPSLQQISLLLVKEGHNAADDKIVELAMPGDLVITADIPLAARIIDKKAHALSPRGKLFDERNIGSRLGVRNLMDELRNSGIETGGPSAYSKKNRIDFSNALDRFLTKHH